MTLPRSPLPDGRGSVGNAGKGATEPRPYYVLLKRCLLIFNALIFVSSVDRGMPSLAAAPEGPYTRPPHSRKAASMAAFSSAGDRLKRLGWIKESGTRASPAMAPHSALASIAPGNIRR